MWKSLLSSFTDDFNATITIKTKTPTKNAIWEDEWTYSVLASGIKCLLLRNSQKPYDLYAWNTVEFIKTTHKARLEKGLVVKEWYLVEDGDGIEYEVKFVELSPWFWGEADHMLLFIDRIKNEWSKSWWS